MKGHVAPATIHAQKVHNTVHTAPPPEKVFDDLRLSLFIGKRDFLYSNGHISIHLKNRLNSL